MKCRGQRRTLYFSLLNTDINGFHFHWKSYSLTSHCSLSFEVEFYSFSNQILILGIGKVWYSEEQPSQASFALWNRCILLEPFILTQTTWISFLSSHFSSSSWSFLIFSNQSIRSKAMRHRRTWTVSPLMFFVVNYVPSFFQNLNRTIKRWFGSKIVPEWSATTTTHTPRSQSLSSLSNRILFIVTVTICS